MTTSTKSVNKALLSTEQELYTAFENRITTLYNRGGLCSLKGRQLFLNSATEKVQVRLQHILMLHRDNDILTTKGTLVYYIRTPKTTDMKKFNTNEFVLKKFYYVKTDKTISNLAVRDYYIDSRSNVEFSNLDSVVNFKMPAFSEIQKQISDLVASKQISTIEANFSLDYFAYLAKCLGKQPRFSLSQEDCLLIKEFAVDPEWIQLTFDKTWTVIDPDFKKSKVDLASQRLLATT